MNDMVRPELFYGCSIAELQNLSCLGALSDATIGYLLQRGELLRLDAGEVLFELGDPADFFVIVLRGKVVFHKYLDGTRSYSRDILPGEQIGFVGMSALHPRVGRAVMAQDGLVLKLRSELFYSLYDFNVQDFTILLMNLARDLGRGMLQLDQLIRREAGRGDAAAP